MTRAYVGLPVIYGDRRNNNDGTVRVVRCAAVITSATAEGKCSLLVMKAGIRTPVIRNNVPHDDDVGPGTWAHLPWGEVSDEALEQLVRQSMRTVLRQVVHEEVVKALQTLQQSHLSEMFPDLSALAPLPGEHAPTAAAESAGERDGDDGRILPLRKNLHGGEEG